MVQFVCSFVYQFEGKKEIKKNNRLNQRIFFIYIFGWWKEKPKLQFKHKPGNRIIFPIQHKHVLRYCVRLLPGEEKQTPTIWLNSSWTFSTANAWVTSGHIFSCLNTFLLTGNTVIILSHSLLNDTVLTTFIKNTEIHKYLIQRSRKKQCLTPKSLDYALFNCFFCKHLWHYAPHNVFRVINGQRQ